MILSEMSGLSFFEMRSDDLEIRNWMASDDNE
jgi:hypothetical protein